MWNFLKPYLQVVLHIVGGICLAAATTYAAGGTLDSRALVGAAVATITPLFSNRPQFSQPATTDTEPLH